MAELHADVPEIVIPRVVLEATTRNVLTMEFVGGIAPGEACSDQFDEETRNRWGVVLAEFLMRGLMEHRFLHADPNLANFAFREDGSVVVYDFGCVKEVPEAMAGSYAELLVAAAEGRGNEVPEILQRMGMHMKDDQPLPAEAIDPYIEMFAEVLRAEPPYTFGDNEDLYRRLFQLGFANMEYSKDMVFPEDAIFIDRALGGHFGNLSRLRATGPWRELVFRYAGGATSRP
jgi:predicted unusual protein kinase regulating ubiquinone biosynthesis (AarF/ABC1/UbiB family)